MRKAIRQPINVRWRQANSKESTHDAGVSRNPLDLTQASPRNFCIDVQKPKDVAMRDVRTGIHLRCATGLAHDKLIAKALRKIGRAVGTPTICDNDFRSGCAFAQMREKRP
jgi:hypothetical protein